MAIELSAEVLAGLAESAEGLPVYLDQREPEIEDPSQRLDSHHWQPASATTSKLTRCLEAVRDVATAFAPLRELSTEPDKRILKQLVTPIYSFAIAIRDLYNDVQSNCWTRLAKDQQKRIKQAFAVFCADVPTGQGALKTARDKISAHLDKDVWTSSYRQFWDSFSVKDVLGWIQGCIKMFDVLIGPDIYGWTRRTDYRNVVKLMNVDGNELTFLLDENEKPISILRFQIVVSPKWGIVRELRDLGLSEIALGKRLGIYKSTTWQMVGGMVVKGRSKSKTR